MKTGRFPLIMTRAIFLNCLLLGTPFAGFGFGGDAAKSGLDLSGGYDINTVTVVSGKVKLLPRKDENEPAIIEIGTGRERYSLYVGSVAFWEKKGIPVRINDDIYAKGSMAQGQDGKVYLITQKLMNRTTGAQLELRNWKGEPVWSGQNQNNMHNEGSAGGMRHIGNRMMRSGGMMRR
jgi:hypothetical protein